MKPNSELVAALTKSRVFQEYERAYNEAIGLPITIRPRETWQPPFRGKRLENAWCALMNEKSGTCAACLQMQEKLAGSAAKAACTMTCAFGLSETAVPVQLGPETIAYIQTGQVLRQKPTEASYQRAVAHAANLGVCLDTEKARRAFFSIPVVTQKKMGSIATMLSIFAEHLSMKSNQIAINRANAEPVVIAKAKQYIEDNHAEDLKLGQVARAVHTSLFYFCKLFKKVTGMNFTEHLSRVRTEKAKNLLLNPNLRVSEIAYEVGFQSLTHFNRVFKKIIGHSPTEYRAQLQAS